MTLLPAHLELAALREIATRNVLEWLSEYPDTKTLMCRSLGDLPKTDMMVAMAVCRSVVLKSIGTLDHPSGADMQIHVRLIESGMSLVDWSRVVKEVMR